MLVGRSFVLVAACAVGTFLGSAALADEVRFEANFSGDSVVPPVATAAVGSLQAVLDTERREITWFMDFRDLSGPATAIEVHGPADEGENGPVVMSLSSRLASPINGGTSFGGAVVEAFEAGLIYIVIGTAAHPEGEIRAQLVPVSREAGGGEDE